MAAQKHLLFVTTADTDLLTADHALAGLPQDFPKVLAYNPAALHTQEERDGLLRAAGQAGVVALRLLGGKRSMPELFEPLVRGCKARGIPLIACPGHQEWDEDLVSACSVPPAQVEAVFSYLMRGGEQNFRNLFLFLSDSYLGTSYGYAGPSALPWEGIYHPDVAEGTGVEAYVEGRFKPGRPSIGLLFYRAHWMSGNLQSVDALIRRLEALGANVLPVFSYSLKHSPEEDSRAEPGGALSAGANRTFTEFLAGPDGLARVHCIVNTMGMSMSELSKEGPALASGWSVEYLDRLNIPIIQAIVSTGTEEEWLESSLGLGPIDTAMSVALPEFDGRIISGPISFKEENAAPRTTRIEARLQRYVPREDRVD
ncbi:MAG: cobaltochelatase subunit CobN, partial [candidate division NC10 bacterium]